VKLLHTGDWHVGKSLRGISRLDEHREVLSEIVRVAREETVDAVLVVGDVFESAVPSPEAQAVAWRALLDLHDTGATVIVVAGNHDSPAAFEAVRPVFAELGITLLGNPARPGEGGVVELTTRDGEPTRVALLPFCSQRHIIRSAELLAQDAAENAGTYAARIAAVIQALCAPFAVDAVNVMAAHCMVRGGKLGGGERDAQCFEDYWVDPTAFPVAAHYVALGHLHRTQQMPGSCPIWYSGSPIQVDFGEEADDKHVLVVSATPSTPAVVRQVPLTSARRLRTVRATLDELRTLAGTNGDEYLRVFVKEKARVGLADEVRALLPSAVDVRIDPEFASTGPSPAKSGRQGRSPHELFAAFLDERGIADDRLTALFVRLLDDVTMARREG
jgi:exonuclease SbcD